MQQISATFGEAVAAVLYSMVGIYLDVQNQSGGFEKYEYLSNESFLLDVLPQDVLSDYSLEALVASKVSLDSRVLFLRETNMESIISFQTIEDLITANSVRPGNGIIVSQGSSSEPVDIDLMTSRFDSVLEGFPVSNATHEASKRDVTVLRELPLNENLSWQIGVFVDLKYNNLYVRNAIINENGRVLPFPMDRMFNIGFKMDGFRESDFDNLVGISAHMWSCVNQLPMPQ